MIDGLHFGSQRALVTVWAHTQQIASIVLTAIEGFLFPVLPFTVCLMISIVAASKFENKLRTALLSSKAGLNDFTGNIQNNTLETL